MSNEEHLFYCNTLSKPLDFDKVYKLFAWLYLLPIFVSAQVSFKTDILGKEGLFQRGTLPTVAYTS